MNSESFTRIGRFDQAAGFYSAGRNGYAPEVVANVAALAGLTRQHRVLDLGTGPAPLAAAFAPLAAEVIAVDPEPSMLALARQNTQGLNVTVAPGSSDDLDDRFGSFRLVVIGRAFHWMDRVPTLAKLDSIIEPGGAVALFADKTPDLVENQWVNRFKEILRPFSDSDPAWIERRAKEYRSNLGVLLDSQFGQVHRISFVEKRLIPVERYVDRAFSSSSSAPNRLGERAQALASQIRSEAAAFAVDGLITEVVETEALVALRFTNPAGVA